MSQGRKVNYNLGFVANPPNVVAKRLRVIQKRFGGGGGNGGMADAAGALVMGGTPGGTVSFENASLPQPGQIIVAVDSMNAVWGDVWDLQDARRSVELATTITDTGDLNTRFEPGQSVDAVMLVAGDRILIKNQADATENGIYIVQASGAPLRTADFDVNSSVAATYMFVQRGMTLNDTGWLCTNNSGSDVVGTDGIMFQQFTGSGSGGAGNHLVTYSLGAVEKRATSGTQYQPVAYQEWFQSEYGATYINPRLVIRVEDVGVIGTQRQLQLKLVDTSTGNSVLTPMAAAGITVNGSGDALINIANTYSIPFSNPSMNTYLQVQIKKDAVGGVNPRIVGMSLKFEV